MAHRGNGADLSTEWSQWRLTPGRSHWISSRYNSDGQKEEEIQPLQEQQTAPHSSSSSYTYSNSTGPPISGGYDPGQGSSYLTGPSYSRSPRYATALQYNGSSTETPINFSYQPVQLSPSASSNGLNTSSQWSSSHDRQPPALSSISRTSYETYTSSPGNSYAANDVTARMGSLALSSAPQSSGSAYPTYGGTQASSDLGSRQSERTLSERYRTIDSKNREFWQVGRVFVALWTEPARSPPKGYLSSHGSHYTRTWLQGYAHTETRRFVIIRDSHGSCLCSPIHTYRDQATLKPNLPNVDAHTIIYTSDDPPDPHRQYDTKDGIWYPETLTKDPIKVRSENRDGEGDLGDRSRLNYSKVYTVEKDYSRVLNIGMVQNIWSLEADAYTKPPPHTSRPPSNKGHRSKGKGKEKERRHR